MQQNDILKWYRVCLLQFPIYIDYWKNEPDVKSREPVYQEKMFKIPYALPSGRDVTLRGKFDSVDIITRSRRKYLYLQENKTKSDIDSSKLNRQLKFDLQTMMYLTALQRDPEAPDLPIGGVRYNVIRRPLSGGKGTIRQHKPTKMKPEGESLDDYYGRLGAIINEDRDEFFARWTVEVTEADLKNFQDKFLNPYLEQLCDWWDWVTTKTDPFQPDDSPGYGVHWMTPYGFWNSLSEGGFSDIDAYIESGSEVGLRRTDNLFPEL